MPDFKNKSEMISSFKFKSSVDDWMHVKDSHKTLQIQDPFKHSKQISEHETMFLKKKTVKTPGFTKRNKDNHDLLESTENPFETKFHTNLSKALESYGWENDTLKMISQQSKTLQLQHDEDHNEYNEMIRTLLLVNRVKSIILQKYTENKGKEIEYSNGTKGYKRTIYDFSVTTVANPVERALLFGQPKNIDELIRYLVPGRKGLWEHNMVTKEDVNMINMTRTQNIKNEYCVV